MASLSLFALASTDTMPLEATDASTMAVIAAIFIFMALFIIAAYVITSFLLGRIFKKAGVPSWKAWVPIYSAWVTLELGDQKGWIALAWAASFVTWIPMDSNSTAAVVLYAISLILSLTASVFLYIAMYKIGLKFGKEAYFVLWAIFIPIVWYAWLAFDKSTWRAEPNTTTYTPNSVQ